MFVIGKASKKEINEMKKLGFDVEMVDVNHFDKALDPKSPDENADRYDKYGDKLVAIYLDRDIVDECRAIAGVVKAVIAAKKRQGVDDEQRKMVGEIFENADHETLDIPEECNVIDHDGWECNGNGCYTKVFYYEDPAGGDSSLKGTFCVQFMPRSTEIASISSNT